MGFPDQAFVLLEMASFWQVWIGLVQIGRWVGRKVLRACQFRNKLCSAPPRNLQGSWGKGRRKGTKSAVGVQSCSGLWEELLQTGTEQRLQEYRTDLSVGTNTVLSPASGQTGDIIQWLLAKCWPKLRNKFIRDDIPLARWHTQCLIFRLRYDYSSNKNVYPQLSSKLIWRKVSFERSLLTLVMATPNCISLLYIQSTDI